MKIASNPDIPLDNKQLRIYNSKKTFTRVSVDEAIARGYNSWKGWKCSAGSRGLYIDYDGNIWIANCASSHFNSTVHANTTIQGWAKKRLEIFGEYPHIEWYNNNTDGGWPLPKENWETCEQHVKLQQELKKQEQDFFSNLGKSISKVDTTSSAWKWESNIDNKDNPWGLLGNIRQGFDIPDEWVTCPYKFCGCGADVILSKTSKSQYMSLLDVTLNGVDATSRVENYRDELESSNLVGAEMNFPIPYQVLWDLGRRCNYNCNYCWPAVHSNTEKFPTKQSIITAIDMIVDHWSNGESIRWNFGGGEPTMHPDFIDILKHLKNRNQWVLVTTNGSRSNKFWKEAIEYINSVNMSAHFSSMDLYKGNEDRFIENCKIMMQHFDQHNDDHWLEIKLMTPPGFLDRALQLKQRIMDLDMLHKPGANKRMKGIMSLVPIRDISDSSKLVGYTENEIEYFKNQ